VERDPLLAAVGVRLLLVVTALVLAGCSPAGAGPAITLSSQMPTPTDVTLTWDGHDNQPVVVEFATESRGPWTILDFLPGEISGYEHPDLLPQTTFHYRVRPVLGPVSGESKAVDAAPPPSTEDWLPPATRPDPAARPVPQGAPTNVVVEATAPDGVQVTWTDNASDEAGYLVEVQETEQSPFVVLFVVDPDVNSVGLITTPAQHKGTFRVRAYRFGAQSNVTEQETGGS
jgi:hypothetical protein